jgi:hypothetical protein
MPQTPAMLIKTYGNALFDVNAAIITIEVNLMKK